MKKTRKSGVEIKIVRYQLEDKSERIFRRKLVFAEKIAGEERVGTGVTKSLVIEVVDLVAEPHFQRRFSHMVAKSQPLDFKGGRTIVSVYISVESSVNRTCPFFEI